MDAVEEIKGRLSIEDVVQRYVDLRRTGSTYKALCPFHQEKTPSFYVTPSRNSYHCFGCGKGGDIFNFVMEMDKTTFPEALKKLAEQAGVSLPERAPEKRSFTNRLYEANQAATSFFQESLRSAQGRAAREYLRHRDFDDAAIEQFFLGYAPDSREQLLHHLHQAGFDDRILLPAGLALQDDGGNSRDRFRGRLMFPILDRTGRVVGFGGRALTDEVHPKYLNSPQTEVFDKSSVLYGIHRAQNAIQQEHQAVLVEGYLDAIRAHLEGYLNTVASLGTAITTPQLVALSRLTDNVVLALDPDAAGIAAAARTTLNALAEVMRSKDGKSPTLNLRIAQLPEGIGDPDDVLRKDQDAWNRAIAESVPAFDFYFAEAVRSIDRSSQEWKQEAIDRILPSIQQFSHSPGLQARWIGLLARETGIDERRLLSSLLPNRTTVTRAAPAKQKVDSLQVIAGTTSRALGTDPALNVEEALVGLLLQLIILPADAEKILQPSQFAAPEHRDIISALLSWQSTGNFDYEMLRETLRESAKERADFLRAIDVPLPDDDKVSLAITYHLTRVQQFRLQARHERANQFLEDVDSEGRSAALDSVAQLISERQEVDQDLARLSRETQLGNAMQPGD